MRIAGCSRKCENLQVARAVCRRMVASCYRATLLKYVQPTAEGRVVIAPLSWTISLAVAYDISGLPRALTTMRGRTKVGILSRISQGFGYHPHLPASNAIQPDYGVNLALYYRQDTYAEHRPFPASFFWPSSSPKQPSSSPARGTGLIQLPSHPSLISEGRRQTTNGVRQPWHPAGAATKTR